jgi:hypothetical protein
LPNSLILPPNAEAVQAVVEQRLAEVREQGGLRESVTVEWRGKPLQVEVIDMPLESLYYNPGTHRVRAQRSHDPALERALLQDPWSQESQDYLDYLLQALPSDPSHHDKAFDELAESLRDFKQIDPGLITRSGILVNGNTRAAALRSLGVASIRVGVLPASCTQDDVDAVELSLQLRPDRRREYSYINHLLALEEQLESRKVPEIIRAFHTTVAACDRDVWVLAQFRDLISRSRAEGTELRLLDFEDSKEKMFELYRSYQKEKSGNRDSAEVLKESKLAVIVLDYAKTDVRYVEADFRERYLEGKLPESLQVREAPAKAAVSIPGLNREVRPSGAAVVAARALTDRLLQVKAVRNARDGVTPAQVAEASKVFEEAREVFDQALTFAGKDSRMRKRRRAAPDRITDASKAIEQGVSDLVHARGSNSLDEEAFDDAVQQLHEMLRLLASEAAESIPIPGDGLAWLLRAVEAK